MNIRRYSSFSGVALLASISSLFLWATIFSARAQECAPLPSEPNPGATTNSSVVKQHPSHRSVATLQRSKRRVASLSHLPLTFEPNKGQTSSRVRFIGRSQGYTAYLTPGELVLTLNKATGMSCCTPGSSGMSAKNNMTVVALQLLGSNTAAPMRANEKLAGVVNYLRGSNSKKWIRHIPTYKQVRVTGVYRGIDMVYYGSNQNLEHDFIIHPGANPGSIRIQPTNVNRPIIDFKGNLYLRSSGPGLKLNVPAAYQVIKGIRHSVPVRYLLNDSSVISFKVGKYNLHFPLVIDPVLTVPTFSTYLGGSAQDSIYGIAVDSSGDIVVAGTTVSVNFPTTAEAFEPGYSGGADAFVAKLDPTGSSLIFCTYVGGSMDDVAYSMALDSTGSAYIAGYTTSANFPITLSALQRTLGSATATNGFITRLTPAGDNIIYSTYFGGTGVDKIHAIAVDGSGTMYVTGETSSTDFPLSNAGQKTIAGTTNAFVAKIPSSGTTLTYSTYFGGSGTDIGYGIAADSGGNAIIVGKTTSSNFPITNAVQTTLNGATDMFVSKLNSAGSALVYSTYLGGSGTTIGTAVTVDTSGNAYAAGYTNASGFPVTTGALQTAQPSTITGDSDACMVELSSTGALVYGTYLGGDADTEAYGIAVDKSGDVALAGMTTSNNFPQQSPVQSQFNGGLAGGQDAFLSVFKPLADAPLLLSSWIGGQGTDVASCVATDAAGNVYLAGSTLSTDFPVTANAYQQVQAGMGDGFVIKLVHGPTTPTNLTAIAVSTTEVDLTWTDTGADATSFILQRQLGSGLYVQVGNAIPASTATQYSYADTGLLTNSTYTYRVYAQNSVGTSAYSNTATVSTSFSGIHSATGLAAQIVSGTEVDLSWTDTYADFTGFRILRASGSSSTYTQIAQVDQNTFTYADTTVQPSTSYSYEVIAFNATSVAAPAGPLTITTPPPTPNAPSGLTATATSQTQVLLTWVDNSTNETGFKIIRENGSTAFTLPLPAPIATVAANVTTFVDTTVVAGATYSYVVVATNSGTTATSSTTGSDSLPSNQATVTTPGGQSAAPAAPSGLTASAASSTEIDLAWTDNSAGVASFVIERQQGQNAYQQIATALAGVTTYQDTGLTAGTTYNYRVKATDTAGTSAYSNVATATTMATPTSAPTAPSGLTATAISATSIQLTWIDNSNNETGFKVQRAIGSGTFVLLATAPANTTTYTDTANLAVNTLYNYRVSATNAAGDSTYSNVATITLGTGTISGTVQIAYSGQTAVASGYTLTLVTNGTSNIVATTVTNAQGAYSFNQIADGAYQIDVTPIGQSTASPQTVQLSSAVNNDTTTANFSVTPPNIFAQGITMVSLPFSYPTTADAAVLTGLQLNSNGSADIASYSPTTSSYLIYPNLPGSNPKMFQPGTGYWIRETTAAPLLSLGATVPSPFSMPLKAGWNMIGDPFTTAMDMNLAQFQVGTATPVSYQTALTQGVVQGTLYTYSLASQSYLQVVTMVPFSGYWIYVNPQVLGTSTLTLILTNIYVTQGG